MLWFAGLFLIFDSSRLSGIIYSSSDLIESRRAFHFAYVNLLTLCSLYSVSFRNWNKEWKGS